MVDPFTDRNSLKNRLKKDKNGDTVPLSTEQKIYNQIQNQKQELQLRGKSIPHEAGGILGKVLDVISRPLYASANVMGGLIQDSKKNAGTVDTFKHLGSNVVHGISGTQKKTYGQVIDKDIGISGHSTADKIIRGVGGFAGDVVLDPSTYVSLGTTSVAREGAEVAARDALKGGLEAAAKTAAGKAAAKASEDLSGEVGTKVSQKVLDNLASKGLSKTAEKYTTNEAQQVSKRLVQDAAMEAAQNASDKVLANTTRTFGVKIGEHAIPVLQSESLYNVGSKISDVFKDTTIGKGLNQTFNTKFKLPGLLHDYKREVEGYSHSQFEDLTSKVRDTFKGVSNSDKSLISDAIEQGKDLAGVAGKNGQDLGVLQKQATDYLSSITKNELDKGILKPTDLLQNYVYHYYKTTDKAAADAFSKVRNKVQKLIPDSTVSTAQGTLFDTAKAGVSKVKSLEEAAKEGLKPVRNIDDIILLRAGKSYGEQARQSMADMVSKEFGVALDSTKGKLAEKLDLVPAKGKYLTPTGVYLPKEVQAGMKQLEKVYTGQEANNLLKLFDSGLQKWKFMATAANPGHHIRNAIGDMFINTLDGVNNPLRYEQAAKILLPESKASIKVGDGILSAEEVKNLFKLKGAKAGFTTTEIGVRKLGITDKIRQLSESREDFTRMAHFVDALKKEGANITGVGTAKGLEKLDKAASNAASRVRKFNFDYGDLTQTEKKVFKRVAPFYTWMRKNVPLQMEALALSPGRQALIPKTLNLMRQLAGDNGQYPQIGGLETVPKYIRDMAGVRILGEGSGRNGVYLDPSVLMPGLDPIQQVGEPLRQLAQGNGKAAFTDVSKTALNQLNPALKAVVTYGTGKDTFTGGDVKDSFIQDQLPATRLLSKALQGGGVTKKDLINYGTGASLRAAGPSQRIGEYLSQRDQLTAALKASGGTSLDLLKLQRKLDKEKQKDQIRQNLLSFSESAWDSSQGDF